jgi:hypothetical protein
MNTLTSTDSVASLLGAVWRWQHIAQVESGAATEPDMRKQLPPEITFSALTLLLLTFLAVILVVFTLISMWKENRFGWPLRGIVWFYLVIVGSWLDRAGISPG